MKPQWVHGWNGRCPGTLGLPAPSSSSTSTRELWGQLARTEERTSEHLLDHPGYPDTQPLLHGTSSPRTLPTSTAHGSDRERLYWCFSAVSAQVSLLRPAFQSQVPPFAHSGVFNSCLTQKHPDGLGPGLAAWCPVL